MSGAKKKMEIAFEDKWEQKTLGITGWRRSAAQEVVEEDNKHLCITLWILWRKLFLGFGGETKRKASGFKDDEAQGFSFGMALFNIIFYLREREIDMGRVS